MTTEKLRSVFQFYLDWMDKKFDGEIKPEKAEDAGPETLMHLAWMCQTAIRELIPQDRIEKAMRWLGFIQGVLVARHFFKLDEVKNHSRPDEDH